jgi:hypothetical protein
MPEKVSEIHVVCCACSDDGDFYVIVEAFTTDQLAQALAAKLRTEDGGDYFVEHTFLTSGP